LRHGGNSLNFLRLALALLVVVSHSFTIGGFGNESILGNQSLGDVAVDGFFGISGFLICGSAIRHIERHGRKVGLIHYFWDRLLRIFPAYWLCLIVTAAIFGPIGWWAVHHTLSGYVSHPLGPFHYIISNFLLHIGTLQISGTPAHVPHPLIWDTSLWTLYWEFLCYIGIAVLAAVGLLFHRRIVIGIAAVVWCAEIVLFFHPSQHPSAPLSVRFASIFLVGALMYLYRDRVPDSGTLALVLFVVACVGFTVGHQGSEVPDWLTGPALVYPVLWLGSHLPFQRVGATNDISYGVYIYAYPIGQLLAIANVQRAGYAVFVLTTVACTLPLAMASWWGLEKWALMARKWQPFQRKRLVAVE
jgi:peptidoglycan/LPS O-acetylase OafA/YrhL